MPPCSMKGLYACGIQFLLTVPDTQDVDLERQNHTMCVCLCFKIGFRGFSCATHNPARSATPEPISNSHAALDNMDGTGPQEAGGGEYTSHYRVLQ